MAITFNHNDQVYVKDGKMGIGASDPLRNLHVVGNFAVNAGTGEYYGVYIPGLGEGADPKIQIGDWHNASGTITWDSSARALNIDTNYSSGAGTFNITGNDGASTFLTVLSSGNVGIGTTSPSKTLSVETNDTATYSASVNASEISIARKNSSNTAGQVAAISLNATGWSGQTTGVVVLNAIARQGNFSNADFAIQNRVGGNFVETFRITTYGNVGIGTDTPDDNVNTGSYFKPDGGGRFLTVKDSAGSFIMLESSTTTDNDQIGGIYFNNTVGQADAHVHVAGIDAILHKHGTNDAFSGGDLRFFTKPSGSGINGPRMIILQNGNVGIGTINPGVKLHVNGGSVRAEGNATDQYFFEGVRTGVGTTIRIYDNANTAYIDSYNNMAFRANQNGGSGGSFRFTGGNVGIGTTSPEQQLDISAATPTILLKSTEQSIAGGDNLGSILFYNNDASTAGGARVNSSIKQVAEDAYGRTALVFGTNTTDAKAAFGDAGTYTDSTIERFRIKNDGTIKLSAYGAGILKTDANGNVSLDTSTYLTSYTETDTLDSVTGRGATTTNAIEVGGITSTVSNANDNILLKRDVSGTVYTYGVLNNAGADFNINGTGNVFINADSNSDSTSPDRNVTFGNRGVEYMRINASGNVGIGTTSPVPKMHLVYAGGSYSADATSGFINQADTGRATMRLRSIQDQASELFFDVDGGIRWDISARASSQGHSLNFYAQAGTPQYGLVSAHTFQLSQNGDVIVTGAGTSGKMGIGTTSPGARLDVNSNISSSSTDVIKLSQATNGDIKAAASLGLSIQNGGESTNAADLWFTTANGGSLSERMRITSSGNVGIGTTAPVTKLHVEGGVTINTGNGSSAFNDLNIGGINGWSNSEAHRINFVYGNGTSNIFQTIESYYGGANEGKMRFRNFYTDSQQTGILMTIHSSGNVGIGTDSPGRKLHVEGGYYLKGGAANTSYVSDGLWGATATPNLLNSTNGTLGLRIGYQDNGSGLYSPAYGFEVKSTDGIPVAGRVQKAIIIKDVDTGLYPFYINNNGSAFFNENVGIGTTSPGAKLTVSGSATGLFTNLLLSNTNDTDGDATGIGFSMLNNMTYVKGGIFFERTDSGGRGSIHIATTNTTDSTSVGLSDARLTVDKDGNVGIGTTNPGAPLDVQPASDYKVTKVGDDRTSHYKFTGFADHTLTLSSGSYHSSEVVITAHQTNGGTNNNLYIRGIWTNNHTSHHWHAIENIGGLSGSTFAITNGQSGSTTNSGELEIVHSYTSGSFGQMVVRVTDHYGTHSYIIS